jgi:thioredoxin 2
MGIVHWAVIGDDRGMALTADASGVLVTCLSCGTTNRERYEHLDRAIRCARCKTALPPPSSAVEIPDAAVFDAVVRSAVVPIAVDFWAPWCGPCRAMAPELEKAAGRLSGRALIVKVNTEATPELGERFRIRSIPTLAVFREGREVARSSGARPAADIEAFISQTAA